MKNIKQQLAELTNDVPKATRVLFFRERLIEKIAFHQFNELRNNQYANFYIFVKTLFTPIRAAYAVVGVFCLFLVAASVNLIPSYGANPGEPLYNARVAIERMPLIVLSDQAKLAKEAELAKKRQSEVLEILASDAGAEDKSKKIESVVKHLSKNVAETKKQMRELGENNKGREEAREAASRVKSSVADIKKSLAGVQAAVAEGALASHTGEIAEAVGVEIADAELATLGVLIDVEEISPEPAAEPATESAAVSTESGEALTEEVLADLERAIGELEKAVGEIEAPEKSAPDTQKEEDGEDVILNVAEIIDAEANALELEKKIKVIVGIIARAKEFVSASEFKSAWGAVKEGQDALQLIK